MAPVWSRARVPTASHERVEARADRTPRREPCRLRRAAARGGYPKTRFPRNSRSTHDNGMG
eukprot:4628552-Prymnesium_polylepis.1